MRTLVSKALKAQTKTMQAAETRQSKQAIH